MVKFFRFAIFAGLLSLISIAQVARSQVYSKTPIGYTEYMGWFPGDSVVWVSDDSGKYYYYDFTYTPPKVVWGQGTATKMPLGVVSIDDEYACKTSDLQQFNIKGRFSASCTSSGWRLN